MLNNQEDTPMAFSGLIPPSLLELSSDLKSMFQKHILCDFMLYIGNRGIPCHRAILKARSRYFARTVDQANSNGCTSVVIQENERIIDAVLVYIYTGNLRLIESLKIPLLDLRDAADKYGLDKFKKLLTKMIKSEKKSDDSKTRSFSWGINIDNCKTTESICSALDNFSLHGTDKWFLKMRPIILADNKYLFGIYLVREMKEPADRTVHIVNLELHMLDANKKPRRTFISDHIFKQDGESKMSEYISFCKLKENAQSLFPDGILSFKGQITVSEEDGTFEVRMFELKGLHERAVTNELHVLSFDMYKLLKAEQYCDMKIQVNDNLKIDVHSYIVYARSYISQSTVEKMGRFGFGNIVWRSFIHFIYTGQSRFLDDHMRLIYYAVSKLDLEEAKTKYSRILINNLNVNNVHGILSDASFFQDKELIYSAMMYIIRNSEDLIGKPPWNQFCFEHPNWVRAIMRSAGYKKFN